MSADILQLTNGRDATQLDRISTLLVDRSADEHSSEPATDLPILASLSHTDPHLSASSFSVEDFLVSRSHTSLPDLRLELRDYLTALKEELVQLINDDYAAFISLSTDLRGEGARLERLKFPLEGVKKEVEASLGQLRLIQETVQARLDERSALREEKALLHLLLKLSESLARLESLLLIASPLTDGTFDSLTHSPSLGMRADSSHNQGFDERSRTNRVKHLCRVATEFTQLLYLVDKARSEKCAFVDEIKWRVDRVKSTLSSDLDHLFAMTLLSLSLEGNGGPKTPPSEQDRARFKSDLKECLRTYDLLGSWRDAEEVVRREIVKSFVKKTIFAGALSVPHSPLIPRTPFPTRTLSSGQLTPGTPYTPFTARARKTPFEPQFVHISESHLPLLDDSDDALAALYNKILRFVERDLKGLMEVAEVFSARRRQRVLPVATSNDNADQTNDQSQHDGFEIMSNVVWAEIGRAVIEELGSTVFAAGRPDDFRQHYTTTQNFMAALDFLAPSLHSVEAMRSHPTYVTFQRRWQLPVYFQLRWKDIVGRLEEALSSKSDLTVKASPEFATSQAAAVFEAIRTCWSAEIYVPEIGHRFWRLTLQILSRYRTWLDANQPPREPSANVVAAIAAEKAGTGAATPNSRATTPIPPSELSGENAAADDVILNRAGTMISDIKQLEKKVLEFWHAEISTILPDVAEEETGASPLVALKQTLVGLTELIPSPASHIIAILTRRSCEVLALTRAIPSQYRAMSNKRMPTEPSHFIPDILKPVKSFIGSVPDSIRQELVPAWAAEVFGVVCHRYISYLVAMRKTEESLRRLKKGKMSAFSLFSGGSPTANRDQESKDEERVRIQMVLDVAALGKDARSLGVDVDNHAVFRELEVMAAHGNAEGIYFPFMQTSTGLKE